MKVRTYVLGCRGLRIAILADIHNRPYEKILAQTKHLAPDLIVVPGDMTYRQNRYHRVSGFLTACAEIAPTFVSVGNHDNTSQLQGLDMGKAVLLNNEYKDITIRDCALRIGGLTSPRTHGEGKVRKGIPNTAWLEKFCQTDRFTMLSCHQPEYFPRYLQSLSVDLTVAGHAHGGQWRIGNRGVYAPGQGLLPKLTGGVVEKQDGTGWLVISRGLSNTAGVPRFFNPREIVIVQI